MQVERMNFIFYAGLKSGVDPQSPREIEFYLDRPAYTKPFKRLSMKLLRVYVRME